MDTVKQAIKDAIELAKMGEAECEAKLRSIDQVKIDLSNYRNDINRLESALRALEGMKNPPTPKSSGEISPSGLPATGMDWFEECISYEPMTPADIFLVAMAKTGIEHPSEVQQRLLRQRIYNALCALQQNNKIIQEGQRGAFTYRKAR